MALSRVILLLGVFSGALAACPNGTYYSAADGMCYYKPDGTYSWSSAFNLCFNTGGQLVVPKNAFENSIFNSVLQDLNMLGSWIGAYSTANGTWFSLDGTQLTYTRWAYNQPYYTSSCASMGADGLWYSDHCDDKEEFVCRINPNSNSSSNSSATTTTTPYPLHNVTLYPVNNVTATPSTPAYNMTQCPGYYTMNSTTPCQSGWKFYLPTCSCYILSTKTLTWFEAENNCVNYKAHLASVHSQDESVFVKSLTTSTDYMIQVGLQYNQGWQWSDGSAVDFLNFPPRTYRSDLTKNPCAAIFSDGFYYASFMQNGPCNTRYSHSVCKKSLV